MSDSLINGDRNTKTLLNEDISSDMENRDLSSPVSAIDNATSSDEPVPCGNNDDCAMSGASDRNTETQGESNTDSINHECVTTPTPRDKPRGGANESSTSPTERSDIQPEEGRALSLVSSVSKELSKAQTEDTRVRFAEVAVSTNVDDNTRMFAEVAMDIVEWWQIYAKKENPALHRIDFGFGSPLNLLMVLALLPEEYHSLISIEDEHRSPSGDGNNLSWLHEQTLDVILQLSVNPDATIMCFSQGLASMVRKDVDEGWRQFTGRSWLEDQIHLCSNDDFESDLYRFPTGTEKIVFFFNPTEIHWTVVEVSLDDYAWTYTLYNSLSQGKTGPTWEACLEQLPLLERLICHASGFTEPVKRKIVTANSAQQQNAYDCGPIALYNAIELLGGRKPSTKVDADELRLRYLRLILDGLYWLDQELELPMLRYAKLVLSLDGVSL